MPLQGFARVVQHQSEFPVRLREIQRSPAELWVRGGLPRPGQRLLAVVGSRRASGAGCERAHVLSASAARKGWGIVSGGAFGIDAAAHLGALDAGGETYAVLGCGVDVTYPDRHERLFARIEGQGGLLSEYPPGTPPRRAHFPQRNRIVAGLAEAVLVVEAAFKSGALSTAAAARRGGQRLLAVPGSPGTDGLIAAGAVAVTSPETLAAALAGEAVPAVTPATIPVSFAPLIDALRTGPETPGGLARRLALSLPAVMGLLLEAELEGWVRRTADSHYEVPRGH